MGFDSIAYLRQVFTRVHRRDMVEMKRLERQMKKRNKEAQHEHGQDK